MFYKKYEFIWSKTDKYTFLKQAFIDKNRTVYCLVVVVDGGAVRGLLQSFQDLTADDMDKAVNEYLESGRVLINFDYA